MTILERPYTLVVKQIRTGRNTLDRRLAVARLHRVERFDEGGSIVGRAVSPAPNSSRTLKDTGSLPLSAGFARRGNYPPQHSSSRAKYSIKHSRSLTALTA
jgi:hypothetical protein